MAEMAYRYYEDDGLWIGWLEDYPDYRTQGVSRDELEENLRDIYSELTGGHIPCVRRTAELLLK